MFTVQQHIEYMAGYELDGQDRYVVIFEDPRPASITRFAPKTPGFVGKNVCLNATEYEVEEAKQRNSGNMPVAINTHMWRNESYYCSLFEKNERAVQWESYVNLTISEFNQTYKDVTSRGYWPTWVDIHIAATGGATGTDESELSALVADARRCGGIFQKIEKSEEDIITVAGVEESEWIGQDNSPHDALVSDGYSPIQISLAYDSLDFSTVYISAIYEKDDKKPGIDWVFERSLMGIYLDSTNRKHVTNGFRIKQAAPITLDYPEGALDEAHFYGLWEKDPALRVEGEIYPFTYHHSCVE